MESNHRIQIAHFELRCTDGGHTRQVLCLATSYKYNTTARIRTVFKENSADLPARLLKSWLNNKHHAIGGNQS